MGVEVHRGIHEILFSTTKKNNVFVNVIKETSVLYLSILSHDCALFDHTPLHHR